MAKSLVLNTIEIEDCFFSDSRLIAIRTGLQGYRLCWYLNNMLRLNIRRAPELDICMDISEKAPDNSGTLFEHIITDDNVHFPVYNYQFPFSEANILVYSNKQNGNILLPDIKQADYLFFLQYGLYLEDQEDYNNYLTAIPEINWVQELNLSRVKWKKNLII